MIRNQPVKLTRLERYGIWWSWVWSAIKATPPTTEFRDLGETEVVRWIPLPERCPKCSAAMDPLSQAGFVSVCTSCGHTIERLEVAS